MTNCETGGFTVVIDLRWTTGDRYGVAEGHRVSVIVRAANATSLSVFNQAREPILALKPVDGPERSVASATAILRSTRPSPTYPNCYLITTIQDMLC